MNEHHCYPQNLGRKREGNAFRRRTTFVTPPVLHTLSEFKSIKDTRKSFCYMLKANHDHFYYRKYSCMTCDPCRTFRTDPFTNSVKCEREEESGSWRKGKFARKPPKKAKKNGHCPNLQAKIRLILNEMCSF